VVKFPKILRLRHLSENIWHFLSHQFRLYLHIFQWNVPKTKHSNIFFFKCKIWLMQYNINIFLAHYNQWCVVSSMRFTLMFIDTCWSVYWYSSPCIGDVIVNGFARVWKIVGSSLDRVRPMICVASLAVLKE